MKERDARFESDAHQMVLFVEKEDGTYDGMQTGSYMVQNYMDDFWSKQAHFREVARTRLLNNEISMVGYYVELLQMAPADVAARMRLSVGQVSKQMRPEGFRAMTIGIAQRYASLFGVALADLFQLPGPSIIHAVTTNPSVVETNCREKHGA